MNSSAECLSYQYFISGSWMAKYRQCDALMLEIGTSSMRRWITVNNVDNDNQCCDSQGVYTLIEPISSRSQEGFHEKSQYKFALFKPAMQCTESTTFRMWWWAPTNGHHCAIQPTTTLATFVILQNRTKTWYAQCGAEAKIKQGDQFLK